MEATLKALAVLLLEAVPTILFFLLVTWFLNYAYFKPVARILEERRKATEGVRELAQRAFEAADKRTSDFERALDLARGELHQEHEKMRQQWSREQAEAIARTRAEVDRLIEEAKIQIVNEVEQTQAELDEHVERLSDSIVNSLIGRKAA